MSEDDYDSEYQQDDPSDTQYYGKSYYDDDEPIDITSLIKAGQQQLEKQILSKGNFGICHKNKHDLKQIGFLCLNQKCSWNRLSCINCIDNEHGEHVISNLKDNALDPIHLLQLNKDNPQALQLSKLCKEKYKNIYKYHQTAYEKLISHHTNKFMNKFGSEFEAIEESFSPDSIQNILSKLSNKQSRNFDYVEKLSEKMNIMTKLQAKQYFKDNKMFRSVVHYQQYTIKRIINQYILRANEVFDEMHQKLDETSLLSENMSQNAGKFFTEGLLSKELTNLNTILKDLDELKAIQFPKIKICIDHTQNALNPEIIESLQRMSSIQQLSIKWNKTIGKTEIKKILEPNKNLRKINLQNLDCIDLQFVDYLVEKYPEVEYFNYGINFQYSFKHWQLCRKFMSLDFIKFSSLDYNANQKLGQLPKLQNIWIGDCEKIQYAKLIPSMSNLVQLTIGDYSKPYEMNIKTIQEVGRIEKLTSLALLNIKNAYKMEYLTSFANLHTLVFYQSNLQAISLDDIHIINKKMQQLCFQSCKFGSKFNFDFIWNITTLKCLILSNSPCSKQSVKNNLFNLKDLEMLDISKNKSWVDDQILEIVGQMSKLTYLNIFWNQQITNHGLSMLFKLDNLVTLICGRTRINGKGLVELTKKLINIQKLGLYGLCGNGYYGNLMDEDILRISENINLTHLDIFGCTNLTNNCINIEVTKIKCLRATWTKLTKEFKEELIKTGVFIC